jgi:hypothetical protein
MSGVVEAVVASRPAIAPAAAVEPELPRHLEWPARLRVLAAALAAELEGVEEYAQLAASSRSLPDVGGAGLWLVEALEGLAAAEPTIEGVGAALVEVACADANLRRVVAGRGRS